MPLYRRDKPNPLYRSPTTFPLLTARLVGTTPLLQSPMGLKLPSNPTPLQLLTILANAEDVDVMRIKACSLKRMLVTTAKYKSDKAGCARMWEPIIKRGVAVLDDMVVRGQLGPRRSI